MTTKTNKTKLVLRHLLNRQTITSMEAISLYGATRLSSIIFRLRKRGFDIKTSPKKTIDKYGNTVIYGQYVLNVSELGVNEIETIFHNIVYEKTSDLESKQEFIKKTKVNFDFFKNKLNVYLKKFKRKID